jgi:hypothetical protein
MGKKSRSGSGMGKKSRSGSGINISDPQHCQEGTKLTDGKINLCLLIYAFI